MDLARGYYPLKPVLRTVIDKNGAEEQIFSPSARMILFSIERAKNPGLSNKEVCEKIGLDPQLPMRWAVKYGTHYTDWIEEAIDQASDDDAAVLERVGMVNALQGNFQFWREMARTKGVIKEDDKPKNLTINTDFTVIMQGVGGNLDAARDKLLQAARGLGDAHRSGVALPHNLSHQPNDIARQGAGAGQVQGESLALADALGTDGGRSEQRTPVPAVPQQATFASAYRVLDEGEVSAGSEEPPADRDLAL